MFPLMWISSGISDQAKAWVWANRNMGVWILFALRILVIWASLPKKSSVSVPTRLDAHMAAGTLPVAVL